MLPPHQHPGRAEPQDGHARSRGLDRQARLSPSSNKRHLRVRDRPHGRRRHALRRATTMRRPEHGDGVRHACRRRSCAAGPTRSRAARPRSCATSSASGCSACPATSGSTRTSPGATSRGKLAASRGGLRVLATEARRVATRGSLDPLAPRSGTRRLASQRHAATIARTSRRHSLSSVLINTRVVLADRPRAHGRGRTRPAHGNTSRGR